jgi:murein tripeptide amidase MpaA
MRNLLPWAAAAAAVCLLPLSAQAPAPAPEPHHLVEVLIRDAATLERLLALDLDLAACTHLELPARRVDVIATAAEIELLRAAGLEFEIAIVDLEQHHARELARGGAFDPLALTPPLGQGAMGGHYTLAQVEAILDSFRQSHPQICSAKTSIGTSIEGRSLWMVKISDNVAVDENEPEVEFDALHHAREPLSMESTLLFMDWLLSNYGTDPDATFLVDNREMFFIPVVNPDGYEYNRQTNPGGGGLWRKNRRNNGGGTFGVDINRNYPTGWSAPNGGSSTNPSSDTYRGTAPLSEPEAAALNALFTARQFVQVFSTHTYTDVLLRPWGWQNGNPANVAQYDRIGAAATAQNGIAHGSASGLLYIAAGTTLDHAHTAHGAFGWTAELGRSDEGGFWPNSQNTVAIANRHLSMFKTIARSSGGLLTMGSVATTEAPGGDGDGIIEPGESGRVVLTANNDGAAAFAGSVTATLTAITPGIVVTNGNHGFGALAAFSSATNAGNPLTFAVPASFVDPVAQLRLTLTGDGQSVERQISVVLAAFRLAVDDDMELDRGFFRGPSTATAGLFERAAPQATSSGGQTIQPGNDHTPAGTLCWITDGLAGTSAGQRDVDSGYTDVVSPIMDLRHIGVARLTFWRWYVDSTQDDPFEVYVSNDAGGNWQNVFSSSLSTNAWVPFGQEIDLPLTDRMQFKVRVQDINASLVEGGVDDFALEAVMPDGSITLLSSGTLLSRLRIGMAGKTGGQGVILLSPGTADIPIPGFGGRLLLDPAGLSSFPARTFDVRGYAAFEVQIPGLASLRGQTLYWQMVHADGAALLFGNRQAVRFN